MYRFQIILMAIKMRILKNRVVNLKAPKKYNGSKLSTIHISVKQQDSSPFLSTSIAFNNDFKDVKAYSTFFSINIEAINNARLTVHYSDSDHFYLIDLNSYIDEYAYAKRQEALPGKV